MASTLLWYNRALDREISMKHEDKSEWMKRRETLDYVQGEVGITYERITDKLYDIEGEFRHKWTGHDQVLWKRVFEDMNSALTGLSVLQMGGGR